jgi:hypothetical protein
MNKNINEEEYRKVLEEIKGAIEKAFGGNYEANIVKSKITELPPSGITSGTPKSNAWIIWIVDDEGLIIDLQVYEVDKNIEYHREKVFDYVQSRMGKTPYLDIGNCSSDWDEWTLEDILFKFGFQYGFKTRKIMIRSLERLSAIKEWELPILKYLRRVR